MFEPPKVGMGNALRFWATVFAVLLGFWLFVVLLGFVGWTLWQVYG